MAASRWVAPWIAVALACCGTTPVPSPFTRSLPAFHEGARIVVVGDLQRTAPVLEFWREQNDAERARVVAAIAEMHPDLVAITGDCVFNGGSDAQWAVFDRLVAPWRAEGVAVLSAFGNHEYWSGRRAAEAHVFARFPLDERRHWFVVRFGPLALVVLDSNMGDMSSAEWAAQVQWFAGALALADADPDVRGVVVLFHHPPYTNSTVTGDTLYVQRDLLPPFVHARKTLAMLNGHVHNYERYVRDGRAYVVSGGGGGPRARLLLGDARRHPDDVFHGPAVRDFQFTVYTVSARGLSAEVRGLARGSSEWSTMDRFEMAWPP